jgi:hypothetical protein
MATYTLISSNVLASSATSVTFSSIPATYTDLVIRASIRTDRAAVEDWLFIKFNGLTTNRSSTRLTGSGSAAASGRSTTDIILGETNAATSTASTFSSQEIYIPSYTASQNKPMSGIGMQENNTTAGYMLASAGLWSNTAAITEINLYPETGPNFVSGSSFYLYGISNA